MWCSTLSTSRQFNLQYDHPSGKFCSFENSFIAKHGISMQPLCNRCQTKKKKKTILSKFATLLPATDIVVRCHRGSCQWKWQIYIHLFITLTLDNTLNLINWWRLDSEGLGAIRGSQVEEQSTECNNFDPIRGTRSYKKLLQIQATKQGGSRQKSKNKNNKPVKH